MKTRRDLIVNSGAITAAIAVPALLIPKTAAADVVSSDVASKGRTVTFDFTAGPGGTYYALIQDSGTGVKLVKTGSGGTTRCIGYRRSAGVSAWTQVCDFDGADRELAVTRAPWIITSTSIYAVTVLAQSSTDWFRQGGYVRYKEDAPSSAGRGYYVKCRYWAWDTAAKAWYYHTLMLEDIYGEVVGTNYEYHNSFVGICNSFFAAMAGCAVGVAGGAVLLVGKGLNDTPSAALTVNIILGILVSGSATLAGWKSAGLVGEQLWAKVRSLPYYTFKDDAYIV